MSNILKKEFNYGYCRLEGKMALKLNYKWEIPDFRDKYEVIFPQTILTVNELFTFTLKYCERRLPMSPITNTYFDISVKSVDSYKCFYSFYFSNKCFLKNKTLNLPSNLETNICSPELNYIFDQCRTDGSLTINLICECYKFVSQTTMYTTMLECYEIVEQNNDMILDEKSLVIFVIGDKRLYANKNLICKNTVFKAMFDCDMKESKTNEVQITDDKYDIFKMLLTYIQSSVKPNFDDVDIETLVELLIIADKYVEEDLKSWCELRLILLINNENCKKFYYELWINNTKYLKKYVQQFIQIQSNMNVLDSELEEFILTGKELLSHNAIYNKYDISFDTKIDERLQSL